MLDVEAEIRRKGWRIKAKPCGRRMLSFVALIESDICPPDSDGWCRHFIGWGPTMVDAMRDAWRHYEETRVAA